MMTDFFKKCFVAVFFMFSALCFSLEFSDVEFYSLQNGIPVYIKNIKSSKISSVNICVKGGGYSQKAEMSGLESSLFNMMTKGSKKYSYSDLKSFFYKTSGRFSGRSYNEGSVLSMSSINSYFYDTLDILLDGFFYPLFAEREFRLLLNDLNQDLQHRMNNPESLLFYYAMMFLYEKSPFASSAVTIDSIKNINLENLSNLHKELLNGKRIFVVAAGNIDSKKLLSKLEEYFYSIHLSEKDFTPAKTPIINTKGKSFVSIHPSASGAAYIMKVFPAPAINDADFMAAKIASNVYSDIMFNVVREKYGVCYTPGSFTTGSKSAFGVEYLTKTSDIVNFTKYMEEARNIMKEGNTISHSEDGAFVFQDLNERLEGYINSYINKTYSQQVSVSGISENMFLSLMQSDDVYFLDKLYANLSSIKKEDVIAAFVKYWINADSRWFAVTSPEDEAKIVF